MMDLKVQRGRWGGALLFDSNVGRLSLFGHYLLSLGVPCESMGRWTLPYHPAREHGIVEAREGTGFFDPDFVSSVIRLEDAGDEQGLVSLFETIDVRLLFEG